MKNAKYTSISIASFISFFVAWWLLTDVLELVSPYSLPSPFVVLRSLARKFVSPSPDGSTLITHILASLYIAILGFLAGAAIGIPVGIALAWSKVFEKMIKPLFDFLRTIPPIGWIPVMIIILGIGTEAKVAVIFIASFTPVVINAYSGIRQTNPIHMWVGQTFGATNRQLLFRVAIPTAMPFIFTGLRMSFNISWTCLVAAELLAATKGLGYMIQISRTIGRADIVLVGMFTIAAVGSLLSYVLELFETRFVKGQKRPTDD